MNTQRTLRGTLAAVAATTLLTACSGASYDRPASGEYGEQPVQIEVTNNNWMDMTVYAVRGGMRVRLGTVTTGAQERFQLPVAVNVNAGDLQLLADPIGSTRAYRSSPIMVEPGARVTWSLENHLALSSHSVRSRN